MGELVGTSLGGVAGGATGLVAPEPCSENVIAELTS